MSILDYQKELVEKMRQTPTLRLSIESSRTYSGMQHVLLDSFLYGIDFIEPEPAVYVRLCGNVLDTTYRHYPKHFLTMYLRYSNIYTGRSLFKKTLPFAKYRRSILSHVIKGILYG